MAELTTLKKWKSRTRLLFILMIFLFIALMCPLFYIEYVDHIDIEQTVELEDIEKGLYEVTTVVWFSLDGDLNIYKVYREDVSCDQITETKNRQMLLATEDQQRLKVLMANHKKCDY